MHPVKLNTPALFSNLLNISPYWIQQEPFFPAFETTACRYTDLQITLQGKVTGDLERAVCENPSVVITSLHKSVSKMYCQLLWCVALLTGLLCIWYVCPAPTVEEVWLSILGVCQAQEKETFLALNWLLKQFIYRTVLFFCLLFFPSVPVPVPTRSHKHTEI